MKIALVLTKLNLGGAEKVTIDLANHLAKSHHVELIVRDSSGPLSEKINEQVSISSPLGKFPWPLNLISHLRKSNPNVIFSTFWDINCILILARRTLLRHSKIIVRDSVSPVAFIKNKQWLPFGHLAYRFCYPHSDAIITLSRELATEAECLCKRNLKQLCIIRNPIPKPSGHKRTLDPTYINLVSIGRLNHQKGFDLLIKATATLIKTHPKIKLQLIGDGPEKKALQTLCRETGIEKHVEFIASKNQIEKLLLNANLYILSSRYEGVSNAMLEAISEGIPVVATSTHTSAADYIIDKKNGILVKETTTSQLINGIDRALKLSLEKQWIPEKPNNQNNSTLLEFENLFNSLYQDTTK